MYWDIYSRNHPKYFFFSPFCNSDCEAHKLFKFYLNVFLELEGRLKSYGGPYLAPGPRVWCNALRSDGIKVIKRWWRRFLSTNRDDHHRYKPNRMNVRNNNCSSSAAVPPECFTFSASVGSDVSNDAAGCRRVAPRLKVTTGSGRSEFLCVEPRSSCVSWIPSIWAGVTPAGFISELQRKFTLILIYERIKSSLKSFPSLIKYLLCKINTPDIKMQ